MPHIPANTTRVHDFDGIQFTSIATPSHGASESAVWRVTIPAGSLSNGPHQLSREEVVVVTAGHAIARIGDDRHPVAAGDTLVVPAFTDFSLDNPSDSPFEAMLVLPVGGRVLLNDTPPFVPPWAA